MEDEGINRYRRGWDASAKADSPGSAAGTPDSAASTRADGPEKGANCDSSAASLTVNITKPLYPEGTSGVTPLVMRIVGVLGEKKWFMWGQPPSAVRRAQLDCLSAQAPLLLVWVLPVWESLHLRTRWTVS